MQQGVLALVALYERGDLSLPGLIASLKILTAPAQAADDDDDE
jgi:hypothetical protein